MILDVFSILALATTLGIGVWAGYRYATESKRVDAIVAASLDNLSLRDTDAEQTAIRDWNWDAEYWWPNSQSCRCKTEHPDWP